MKLVELARKSISLLQDAGSDGIRSDELAEKLAVPKRRVYDVVAVLKALGMVATTRRFNGTTLVWIDLMKDYVQQSEYDDIKQELEQERRARKELQTQLAETRESLRKASAKLSLDEKPTISSEKTEFNTTHLKVRSITGRGFKKVADSGLEVILETYDSGMIVEPTHLEYDETRDLLKSLQKL